MQPPTSHGTSRRAPLGWAGPQHLGTGFARGSLRDRELPARVLTPTRLLDLVMRRNLGNPQIRCFQDGKELHPGAYLHQDVGAPTSSTPRSKWPAGPCSGGRESASPSTSTVEVLSTGKKLTFKAKALPALRLLLSGRPVPLDRAKPAWWGTRCILWPRS